MGSNEVLGRHRSGTRRNVSERQPVSWLVLLLSLYVAAPLLAQGEAEHFPGLRLAERLEAHIPEREARLRWESLGHYALIAEVEQSDLLRWIEPVSLRRGEAGLIPHVRGAVELHGGALLDFLFQHWRPDSSRPAQPSDRFPFARSAEGVPLEGLYASHQRQIFLPVPGLVPAEIEGQIPGSPQLPRMRFVVPGRLDEVAREVERDAYSFLRLLVAREDDFAATWVNQLGQQLSVDLLLEHASGHYLAQRSAALERSDHSYLHLIEIFLAYRRGASARSGAAVRLDPDEIKRRFLSVELQHQRLAEADDVALAHYVESLGLLLADSAVAWDEAERTRARAWLRGIEANRFRDLAAIDADALTHLLRGLRLVLAHSARLEDPRSKRSGANR